MITYVGNLQRDDPSNMVNSKIVRKEEPNTSNLTNKNHTMIIPIGQ